MEQEWTDERVVNLDPNFHLVFRGVTLYINKENRFVIKTNNQEYIGPLLVNFPNDRVTHCVLTHSPTEINLYLNANLVIQVVDSELAFFKDTFELQPKVNQTIKVITQDLSPWVSKRQSMFKIKQQTSEKYNVVPIQKQIEQLNSNIMALEELCAVVKAGKIHFIVHILASLRSLLFYKEGSRNYDPLLLRIAAYKGIGIPVYVLERFKQSLDTSNSFSVTQLATFYPHANSNKMIDFQDYLESHIINTENTLLTPLQFIEDIATTQSIAHFDQRIPKTIANFEETPVFGRVKSFDYVTIELALLTVQVGRFILKEMH